jgi:uncharacterized membrane protein
MDDLINLVRKKKLALIILLLVATDIAILLDIPIMRQVLGFLFLTFIPGLLIFRTLRLNELGLTERIVLSVGLSLALLMLFGLLLNNLSLSLDYETPLATIPLLISFNIAFIALAIIGDKINKNPLLPLPNLNLTVSEKVFLIIPVLFPALSIFGMYIMNTTDNNIILMFLLFLIPAYVAFVCFFNQKFPKRLYPVVIFLIGISILLLMSLRSSHIIGTDSHSEYYFFQTTLNNLQWNILGYSILDACLSISLLPTIYQSILDINSEYLFKILYSVLFSFCPLVIYIISKKYVGDFYSFLVSCFFMSQYGFKVTPLWARINIAILFFALAIMVLSHDNISKFNKKVLFIIFAICTIVSHYSTTYIFLFILLFTWIGQQILLKVTRGEREFITIPKNNIGERTQAAGITTTRLSQFEGYITITSVALFFAMLFFWYSQLTEVPFKGGVRFVDETFRNLHEFFILESRSGTVEQAFGCGFQTVPEKIELVFSWLTILFIAIGILTMIGRFTTGKKSDFLLEKIGAGYLTLAIACFTILVFTALAPHASTYGIERTYFQLMVPLSMFFVIGGITASKHLKLQPYLLLLIVLIPYFMCSTGTMYQIFDVSREITLNSEGSQYNAWYVHDQESYGAKWLADNGVRGRTINTDFACGRILVGYFGDVYPFNRFSLKDTKVAGYIFLRYHNIVDCKFMDSNHEAHNITEYQDKFVRKNKIYSNGGSEVWGS